MSSQSRWNKLIPNTPVQVGGVWGLWDEGPPDGAIRTWAWSTGKQRKPFHHTIEWYSVTYLKLLSKTLYHSTCCSPIGIKKSKTGLKPCGDNVGGFGTSAALTP